VAKAPLIVDESTTPDIVESSKPRPSAATKRHAADYSEAEILALRAQNAADRDPNDPALQIPDVTDAMPVQVVAAPVPGVVTGITPAPKRRGRPPKVKPDSQEAGESASPPVVDSPTLATVNAPAPTYAGVFFYFGCYPNRPTKTLHAFMEPIQESILRRFEASRYDPEEHFDLRLSEHPDLKFAKWKGWLAAVAKETALEPGHYVIGTEDDRISVIADALQSKVEGVTRGGR
jgi:hypothetical protein